MGKINDDFEIAADVSMGEIKQTVDSWLESAPGKKFTVEAKSEGHIILRRIKRRLSVCTTPLWAFLAGQIYLGSMSTIGIDAQLTFWIVVGASFFFGLGAFFLRPKRSAYSMEFDIGTPTRVQVDADVNIIESIPEYYALKISLRSRGQDQGPVIIV